LQGFFRPNAVRFVVAAVVLLIGVDASAQEAKPAADSGEPARDDPLVQSPVDLLLTTDEDGNRRLVAIGKTLEFLEAAERLLAGRARGPEKPRFTISTLQLKGRTEDSLARLTATVTVQPHTDQLVAVPLGLNDAVLQRSSFTGGGTHFLTFDPKRSGYVLWLRGEPESDYELVLQLLAEVEQQGAGKSLRLIAPRAEGASKLELEVDTPNAQGTLPERPELLERVELASGITKFIAHRVQPDFEISWRRPPDGPQPSVPRQLSVTGYVHARLDGTSALCRAQLNVKSIGGGKFDRFRVRLPEGARLISGSQIGYELVPIVSAEEGRLVDVRFEQETAGPVDVWLRTETSHGTDPKPIQLGGFEVLGSPRGFVSQSGYLAVEVTEDWVVQWSEQRAVQRIEIGSLKGLSETTTAENLTAAFKYLGQPFSLKAQLRLPSSQVSVDPRYTIDVAAGEARLQAELNYRIRGRKEFELVIDMSGWQDEHVEEGEGIDAANTERLGDVLRIPLAPAHKGPLTVSLTARRPLFDASADEAAESGTLNLMLPTPRQAQQHPAAVAVVSADNVRLTPQTAMIEGLVAGQVGGDMQELPERQQPARYYRSIGGKAVFVADWKLLPGRVTADVETQLQVGASRVDVDQRFGYRIEHEPIETLNFELPGDAMALEDLVAFCNENQVETRQVDFAAADGGESAGRRLQVALPEDVRIGSVEVRFQYAATLPEPVEKGEPPVLGLPLLMPEKDHLRKNEVALRPASRVEPLLEDSPWQVVEQAQLSGGDQGGALLLRATEKASELRFAVRPPPEPKLETVSIPLVWLQTLLDGSVRQDRVCFRLRCASSNFTCALPDGVNLGEIAVKVDRQRVTPEPSSAGITIPLPRGTAEHTVELLYRVPIGAERLALAEHVRLDPPRFGGETPVYAVYWQVVLPEKTHVLLSPRDYLPEYDWSWSGWYWARRPNADQADLEGALGVAAQPPLPGRTNRYLFSSRRGFAGALPGLQLQVAGRPIITLVASLAMLTAVLVLRRFSARRRAHAIFLGAVGLMVLAATFPEPAVLLAQASALGLMLAIVYALLARLVPEKVEEQPVEGAAESSLLLGGRSSTESYATEFAPAPAPGTSTLAVPVSDSNG